MQGRKGVGLVCGERRGALPATHMSGHVAKFCCKGAREHRWLRQAVRGVGCRASGCGALLRDALWQGAKVQPSGARLRATTTARALQGRPSACLQALRLLDDSGIDLWVAVPHAHGHDAAKGLQGTVGAP